VKKKTRLTKFPCPICGTYYLPKENLKTKALMICSKHGMFETDIYKSLRFRKFCSIVGSKPNRDQGYYTPPEERIKKYLNWRGLTEGIDYIHNCRMKNGRTYFWLDFYLPRIYYKNYKSTSIGADPKIWHKLWNRQKSDKKKVIFLEKHGIYHISLDEKEIAKIDCRKKHPCSKLDILFEE